MRAPASLKNGCFRKDSATPVLLLQQNLSLQTVGCVSGALVMKCFPLRSVICMGVDVISAAVLCDLFLRAESSAF